jgi:hypothetical protein
MKADDTPTDDLVVDNANLPRDPDAMGPPAWEEIETGRFQPKRIRGSCLGRELG